MTPLPQSPQIPRSSRFSRFSRPGSAARSLIDARIAGLIYLVIIGVGVLSEVVLRSRLIVSGDPAATAAHLRESGWLLRAVVAADLGYLLGEVVLVVILFVLLRPVSEALSLAAAAARLVSLAISGLNQLNLVAAAAIVADADYLTAGREPLALLFLDLHGYGSAIGLMFFAVNCFFMGALLIGSRHVSSRLGVLLAVAGVGYLVNSLLVLLLPGSAAALTPLLLAPAFVAEAWFCAVLLRTGGGERQWDEPAPASASAAAVG